ncbi:MAG: hypothetical protein ACLP01_18690 [Solirubrobacteraceae bacterium]
MLGNNGGSFRAPAPAERGLDGRIHDVLSELHAYVLVLDAERHRLVARLEVLRDSGAAPPERVELERRHCELTEELDALRATIDKLREYADPDGQYL